MSDTPKTDAQKRGDFVHVNFARQLERENAALLVELEQQAICNGAGAERELALRSTITELQRENAALRADKERLDWIARNRSISATERPWSVTPESLRESIEAARKEQP